MTDDLKLSTEVQDLGLTANQELVSSRTAICQSCDKYIPASYVQKELVDAVTGIIQTDSIYQYETCGVITVVLTEFLKQKASVCPLGKW